MGFDQGVVNGGNSEVILYTTLYNGLLAETLLVCYTKASLDIMRRRMNLKERKYIKSK